MINILYITYTLEPAGAERVLFSLVCGLDRSKYRPVVCSLKKGGDLVEKLEKNNVKVIILQKRRGLDLSIPIKLRRIIKKEKIDLIHSHNFSANFWGRIAGRLGRAPFLIATEHSLTTNKNWLQKRVDRLLSMFTDRIIAVSEAVQQSHILEENIPPQKIVTIYNGVNLDHFNDIKLPGKTKAELGLKPDTPIVGIVGRLTEPKGHRYFLEAASEVAKSFSDAKFIIVGDGDLKENLADFVKGSNLGEKVMFLGFREDRLNIINIFDVAVLSSVREGLPITLLEYMALKKPIVVTDVGGMPELIHDSVNGFVVPPADPDSLAARIIEILKDKESAAEMGLKSYTLLQKKFTEEAMLKNTEDLYNKIMDK